MDDPKVVITAHEGGFIAMMHTGPENIRHFVAHSMENLKDTIGSVAVSEFRMVQDEAHALAARAIETFKSHSKAWDMAKAENEKLRGALRKAEASMAVAKADAEPAAASNAAAKSDKAAK